MPCRLKRCLGPGCLSPCNVMDTPDLEKLQISKAESWCWGLRAVFNWHKLLQQTSVAIRQQWSFMVNTHRSFLWSLSLYAVVSIAIDSVSVLGTHCSVLPGFVVESKRSETWRCPWSSHRSLLASRSVSRSARMSPRHSDNFLQWNACRINVCVCATCTKCLCFYNLRIYP